MKKSRLRDEEDDEDEYEERRPGKASRAQKESDRSDLNMLSMIYNILSILNLIGGVMMVLALVGVGILFMVAGSSAGGGKAALVGLVPMGFALFLALVLGVGVYIGFLTAQSYRDRRRWTLCFVMACLSLPSVPLGTLLGIYAIIVLNRPSVKKMFR